MFKGYRKWNRKLGIWIEDEWLVELFEVMRDAKDRVIEWGKGAPFDNNRELQITRYFGKACDIFGHGPELREGDAGVCEKEWLRYAEFEVHERSDQECRHL